MLVTGPRELEGKRDSHIDDLNDSIEKMSYGRHVVSVPLIQSPEAIYRARVALQENVDTLQNSLMEYGTINENVQLVLFVSAGRVMPQKSGFKPPQTPDEMKARGFEGYFTIVGDHTQRAMNQLHKKFKANAKWATLTAVVYVCTRSSKNYQILKSWGILDNVKGETRVAVSFVDKITCLHDDCLNLLEHSETAGHKERTAQLKLQRCAEFGISSGQMMQLWSLASRTGPVWVLLKRIMNGDIAAPPIKLSNSSRRGKKSVMKPAKSAACFTNIGGLDEAQLVPLLEAVACGRSTLQTLNDQCSLTKARMRVQTAVLTDSKVSQTSWEDAVGIFVRACDDEFVERWAVAINRQKIKQRDSLPAHFFEELERRITADVEQPRQSQQVLFAVSLILMNRVVSMSLFNRDVVVCLCTPGPRAERRRAAVPLHPARPGSLSPVRRRADAF